MVGDQDLADCTSRVVADQRHVAQVERLHEVDDDPGNPRRAQVRHHAAKPPAEAPDDVAPQSAVGQYTVHEEDRLPTTDLAVPYDTLRKLDLPRLATLPLISRSLLAASNRCYVVIDAMSIDTVSIKRYIVGCGRVRSSIGG